MFFVTGLARNPFRFPITPASALAVPNVWFPLASAPAAFWNCVRSDGGDIRVTTQDGVTPVPFHLVGFNSTTKVGSLFIASGTATAFYICCGNRQWTAPAVGDPNGQYAAYDVSHRLVYHCEDFNDATGNQNNAIAHAAITIAPEQILNGFACAGTTSTSVQITHQASQLLTAGFTILAWLKMTSGAVASRLCSKNDLAAGGYEIHWPGDGSLAVAVNGTVGYTSTTLLPLNALHHVALTISAAGAGIAYQDGQVCGAGFTTGATSGITSTANLYLCNRADGTRYWTGTMDEINFISGVWTAAQVAQFYANQATPGTFWSVGALVPA